MALLISKRIYILGLSLVAEDKSTPAPACQILEVHTEEVLTGFTLIQCLEGVETLSHYLKAVSSGWLLEAGNAYRTHIPKTGEGVKSSCCHGPAHESASDHILSLTCPTFGRIHLIGFIKFQPLSHCQNQGPEF